MSKIFTLAKRHLRSLKAIFLFETLSVFLVFTLVVVLLFFMKGLQSDQVSSLYNVSSFPLIIKDVKEDKFDEIKAVLSDNNAEFYFYKGAEKILPKASDCRNEDQQYLTKANNYLVKDVNFDYIQVRNHHGYCGIIVPIFKQQRNVEQFEFAVDLGTSNTHIEYRKGEDKPQVFGFSKADRQLCEMFTPTKNEYGFFEDLLEETELIERDFLPEEIGSEDY